MARITALIIALLAFTGVFRSPGAPTDPTAWTADQAAYVDEARSRFDAAGLPVPDLAIEFVDDRTACGGHAGIYFTSRQRVRICWMRDTALVHELAHALLEPSLTDETKDAFMELRSLDTWVGGAEWADNGAEQAAEILTWGIMARDITVTWLDDHPHGSPTLTRRLFRFDHSSPAELWEAYVLLTGTEPTLRGDSLTVTTTTTFSPEAVR